MNDDPALDSSLYVQWRSGVDEAGRSLFERHFDDLLFFFDCKVSARDAEDLASETVARCIEARARIRGDSSFRTFLLSIARNVLYEHYRRRRRDERRWIIGGQHRWHVGSRHGRQCRHGWDVGSRQRRRVGSRQRRRGGSGRQLRVLELGRRPGRRESRRSGYRIYHADSPSGAYSVLAEVGNVTSFTAKDLSSGTHCFSVKAFNPAGESATAGCGNGDCCKTIP